MNEIFWHKVILTWVFAVFTLMIIIGTIGAFRSDRYEIQLAEGTKTHNVYQSEMVAVPKTGEAK